MGTVRIHTPGDGTIWAQGLEIISGDAFSGYTYQTSFEGDDTALRNLAVDYGNAGYTIKYTSRKDATSTNYATLEVSKPDDTVLPPIIWHVNNQRIDKHLLDAIETPLVKGLSSDTKHAIEDRCRKSNSPKPAAKNGENPDQIEALISLMTTGTDSKRVLLRTIKRTQVLPYGKLPANGWATTYEDKVISRSTLIAAFTVPPWLQPFLPVEPVGGVQRDPVTKLDTMWGFLVDGVDGDPNAKQRQTWEQVFTWNNWSVYPNGIYEPAN